MSTIPEGFAFIEGRDPKVAKALFAAAEKAGVDVYDVRTDSRGYIFPDSLVDHYQAPKGSAEVERGEAAEEAESGVDGGKQAPDAEAEAEAARIAAEKQASDDAAAAAAAAAASSSDVVEPKKSGSTADWVAFAQTKGYDEKEGLSRDELAARYGSTAE